MSFFPYCGCCSIIVLFRYSTSTLFFGHLLTCIVRLCDVILLARLFEVKLTKMSFVVEKNPIYYIVVEFIKEKISNSPFNLGEERLILLVTV